MRLLVLVLALGLIASAVLELRQRRLERLHAMAVLHMDMDRHRRTAWDLQHRVSEATSPAALLARLGLADPALANASQGSSEPAAPGSEPAFRPIPQVEPAAGSGAPR
ncbi:hypothetical protein [Phycisphaera mikurensis]|uniref:Cell division protein FtsL n=1 Tax=Phycisphaera mikurensis (strain NBRC 102666 / KCTC 22515 / FYK2301M01) TaxID=1142394 RepID=I0IGC0_PHYMF|nr:hypothetical protein [Phycisphaera mikurensis]MBB6440313.1 hypothetical protein [Phycisphaera mikurensis]BAM04308.1 hypothetical protein PSMK_21490 [Phycisphaera mikurensis NBRC 102666]